jgi:hypothetical protein
MQDSPPSKSAVMTFTETGTTPSHHNEAVIYAQCLTGFAASMFCSMSFAKHAMPQGIS